MKTIKIMQMRKFATILLATKAVILFMALAQAEGAVISGWDFNALSDYGPSPFAPSISDPNVSVVGLTRGPGVGTSGTAAARAWGGNNWDGNPSSATSIANGDYATFSIQAEPGYSVSFTSIDPFQYRRSGTGPTNGLLQYDVGSGFTDITSVIYSSSSSPGVSISAIDLSGISELQNVPASSPVSFRIVNWGATGSTGTWYLFDVAADAGVTDFAINGATTAVPEPSTIALASLSLLGMAVSARRRSRHI